MPLISEEFNKNIVLHKTEKEIEIKGESYAGKAR